MADRYVYTSSLAPYMNGLLEKKRTDGYRYEDETWHLKKLDDFLLHHAPDAKTITKETADLWCRKRDTEGNIFLKRRIVVLRQLCIYMTSMGNPAYIPKDLTSGEKPILYIPAETEIRQFFDILDALTFPARYTRFSYEYRMLFRLYYCCGMRLSEARTLKKEHFDTAAGILTVLSSKGQKDRLVYLPEDGKTMLTDYLAHMQTVLPDTSYIFPGYDADKPVSGSAIEHTFRLCWSKLPGKDCMTKKPTVHCLRHAFVVARMNAWMREGAELDTMLPYLSSYLGHKTPAETFYYYHMADSAFTVIREKSKLLENRIPGVMTDET